MKTKAILFIFMLLCILCTSCSNEFILNEEEENIEDVQLRASNPGRSTPYSSQLPRSTDSSGELGWESYPPNVSYSYHAMVIMPPLDHNTIKFKVSPNNAGNETIIIQGHFQGVRPWSSDGIFYPFVPSQHMLSCCYDSSLSANMVELINGERIVDITRRSDGNNIYCEYNKVYLELRAPVGTIVSWNTYKRTPSPGGGGLGDDPRIWVNLTCTTTKNCSNGFNGKCFYSTQRLIYPNDIGSHASFCPCCGNFSLKGNIP
jgi:hypothetical protein